MEWKWGNSTNNMKYQLITSDSLKLLSLSLLGLIEDISSPSSLDFNLCACSDTEEFFNFDLFNLDWPSSSKIFTWDSDLSFVTSSSRIYFCSSSLYSSSMIFTYYYFLPSSALSSLFSIITLSMASEAGSFNKHSRLSVCWAFSKILKLSWQPKIVCTDLLCPIWVSPSSCLILIF